MSRRFQGGAAEEILNANTVLNQDMIQVRHSVGTENDSDKGLPLSVIQSAPVAICESKAMDAEKIATVSNFSDFTLLNGRDVICYMADGNRIANPTFNLNNSGAVAMERATWQAGTFLRLKYVDITVGGNRIQKWLVEAGAENTTKQIAISEENTNKKITNAKTDLEKQIAESDAGSLSTKVTELEGSISTVETKLNATKSDIETSVQGLINQKLYKARRQNYNGTYTICKITEPGVYLVITMMPSTKKIDNAIGALYWDGTSVVTSPVTGASTVFSYRKVDGGLVVSTSSSNYDYLSVLKLCGNTDDFIAETYPG